MIPCAMTLSESPIQLRGPFFCRPIDDCLSFFTFDGRTGSL
jgi:hypothetical protein